MKLLEEKLISEGEKLHKALLGSASYTSNPEANTLATDLEEHPHAFVIGCIADRQVRAELAWGIPFHIAEKLGGRFDFPELLELSQTDLDEIMSSSGHRYWGKISICIHLGLKRIADQYDGDAGRIWAGKPSSAAVVYRFLEFKGIGQKISNMTANILARDFGVELSDRYSIDIAAGADTYGLVRITTGGSILRHRSIHENFGYHGGPKRRGDNRRYTGLRGIPAWC